MDLSTPNFVKPEVTVTRLHAHKSIPVASPKELVLFLRKMNLRTKFDTNRTRNGSAIVDTVLKWAKPEVNWQNCGRYSERTVMRTHRPTNRQTDRQTDIQVIWYQSNAIHCTVQTTIFTNLYTVITPTHSSVVLWLTETRHSSHFCPRCCQVSRSEREVYDAVTRGR